MHKQRSSHVEFQHTFLAPTSSARRAINRAIEEARRARVVRQSRTTIRLVFTGPERKTWWECSKHGRVPAVVSRGRHDCPRCGSPMHRHEWVRPDIAAAERRQAYWQGMRESRRRHASARPCVAGASYGGSEKKSTRAQRWTRGLEGEHE